MLKVCAMRKYLKFDRVPSWAALKSIVSCKAWPYPYFVTPLLIFDEKFHINFYDYFEFYSFKQQNKKKKKTLAMHWQKAPFQIIIRRQKY